MWYRAKIQRADGSIYEQEIEAPTMEMARTAINSLLLGDSKRKLIDIVPSDDPPADSPTAPLVTR